MPAEVVMPRLSDSMEEGTILRWIKSVGDEVAVGDELVEIETDKANMVYESDAAGTLLEITVPEGETRPIGEVIARIGEPGEAPGGDGAAKAEPAQAAQAQAAEAEAPAPEPAAPAQTAPPEPQAPAPAAGPGEPSAARPAGDGRPKASPLARRLARELGVELSALSGSGPGGRIVKADVERAAAAAPQAAAAAQAAPAPAPAAAPPPPAEAPAPPAPEAPERARGEAEVVEPTRTQQTIARRMAESKATAPHFYLQARADVTAAVAAREQLKQSAKEGEVVPSLNDLVVRACALSLRAHPNANAAYRDGRFERYRRVNVGIAVAREDALLVATIFDADRKGLTEIAAESRRLAARVREGTITPPELSGATFTVSNLGMYGVESFQAVINPPQAAILAVGAVTETPVIADGELTTRKLMYLNLACDHRILYGAQAAELLATIRRHLEQPLRLAM